MKILFALCIAFFPMIAGCFAVAGEEYSNSNAIQLTWETLLTIYGPMAVWLLWFIRIDSIRRKEDEKRREEWIELLKKNTEMMAIVKEAMSLSRADDDKQRSAIHRLAEEVKEASIMFQSRINTRIVRKQ